MPCGCSRCGGTLRSQDGMAEELGVRQQTVSEWETGRYAPRGASARLLSLVAERAGFRYGEEEGRGKEEEASHGKRRETTDERALD